MKKLFLLLCLVISMNANASPLIGSGPYEYHCQAAFSNSSIAINQIFNVLTQSESTTLAGNEMALFINQNYPGSTIAFLLCEPGHYSQPPPLTEKQELALCQSTGTCASSASPVQSYSIDGTVIFETQIKDSKKN